MGFLKKLKDVTEKGIEKGAELGTRGYDAAKDAATRGHEKGKIGMEAEEKQPASSSASNTLTTPQSLNEPQNHDRGQTVVDTEAVRILKLRLVNGEITKEEFEEMKKVLE
jgi:hypothetical protein